MNEVTGVSFLPLGGTGEIGMNLNLYRQGEAWLAVDCGIGFSGNDTPEAEILLPDPVFIAERRKALTGLVVTHAHEDHLGAIAHLWPQLGCPVYVTPFAAAVLRRKLGEGREGVLAMVCDSTNVRTEGPSASEADVRREMTRLIASLEGRIAVTCFASNVARVETLAMAAKAAGRRVAVVGRSLRNLEVAARECGYLSDVPHFLSEQDANSIPDNQILLIVTGSQGEPRSALSRIAADTHPNIALGEGDTVIYSSRMIPGNEQAVIQVQDSLTRRGVHVITDKDHLVHVSGHATGGDVRKLYDLVRPRFLIPVHGEWRHLTANAAIAQELNIEPVLLEDGDILDIRADGVEIGDTAPTGRLVLDGGRILPMNGGVLSARRRMLFNGMVLGSFAVDEEGYLIGDPKVSAPGLLDADDPETQRVTEEFGNALDEIPDELRENDATFREAAKTALRRALGRKLQKRPLVDVHLLRV